MATSIVIVGVGGQGVLTLARWIGEAALAGGYDVRIAEVHGMSQRGGSVEAHVKFRKEVYAP
jgi:indolepyruvate ferredoxin oxidoreductase beta subunit